MYERDETTQIIKQKWFAWLLVKADAECSTKWRTPTPVIKTRCIIAMSEFTPPQHSRLPKTTDRQ